MIYWRILSVQIFLLFVLTVIINVRNSFIVHKCRFSFVEINDYRISNISSHVKIVINFGYIPKVDLLLLSHLFS